MKISGQPIMNKLLLTPKTKHDLPSKLQTQQLDKIKVHKDGEKTSFICDQNNEISMNWSSKRSFMNGPEVRPSTWDENRKLFPSDPIFQIVPMRSTILCFFYTILLIRPHNPLWSWMLDFKGYPFAGLWKICWRRRSWCLKEWFFGVWNWWGCWVWAKPRNQALSFHWKYKRIRA